MLKDFFNASNLWISPVGGEVAECWPTCEYPNLSIRIDFLSLDF